MSIANWQYRDEPEEVDAISLCGGGDDPDDDEPFSRVADRPPATNRRIATAPAASAAPLRPLQVAILGPRDSGKTSFVASLQQSVLQGSRLRGCVPRGDTRNLVRRAKAAVQAGDRLADTTSEWASLEYRVELTGLPVAINLLIHDGPLDLLAAAVDDPAAPSSPWIERFRSSEVLVLCVDAMKPARDRWMAAVGRLAEQWTEQEPEPGAELGDEPALIDSAPTRRGHRARTLPFQRVLFLLSRIDRLAVRVVEHYGNGVRQPAFVGSLAAAGPRAVARAIEPVLQLGDLVGTDTIAQLFQFLAEDAEVAVTAVAAAGFVDDERGDAVFDRAGRRRAKAGDRGPAWTPFGVEAALDFIVSGRCGSPLVPLSRDDLRRLPPFRLA